MSILNTTSQPQPPVISDEIDLFELVAGLWRQKKLIIGCTLLVGALGVSYALLAPRIYQVNSVLQPVSNKDLDTLNRSGIYKLSPVESLVKLRTQLASYNTRLAFFKDNPDLFKAYLRPGQSVEQSFEAFNSNGINLVLPDPKKAEAPDSFVRLEMLYPKEVDGAAILNSFVDYAIAGERERVNADLKKAVSNRLDELKVSLEGVHSSYEADKESHIARLLERDKIKRAHLEDELDALRVQLKTERSNRLEELAEAISIARSMGIKKPATPTVSGQVMRIEINNQKTPLYFLGTDALEAERAALQQRTNDDFTNPRVAHIGKELQMLKVNREVEALNKRADDDVFLRDAEPLRAEETRLRNLNVDLDSVKFVTVDRPAQAASSPIKPRKPLIVALSLGAGLLLGLLVALTCHFIQTRRSPHT